MHQAHVAGTARGHGCNQNFTLTCRWAIHCNGMAHVGMIVVARAGRRCEQRRVAIDAVPDIDSRRATSIAIGHIFGAILVLGERHAHELVIGRAVDGIQRAEEARAGLGVDALGAQFLDEFLGAGLNKIEVWHLAVVGEHDGRVAQLHRIFYRSSKIDGLFRLTEDELTGQLQVVGLFGVWIVLKDLNRSNIVLALQP